jgi:hypothetical protein
MRTGAAPDALYIKVTPIKMMPDDPGIVVQQASRVGPA